jgi:hypothetical protein
VPEEINCWFEKGRTGMKLQKLIGVLHTMKPARAFLGNLFVACVFSLLLASLSCGPNPKPTASDCKAFAQKLKKLPPPTTIPNVESSTWAPMGNDFVTVGVTGMFPNEKFRFSKLTRSGQSTVLGTAASQTGNLRFLSGEQTLVARIEGFGSAMKNKLVIIDGAGVKEVNDGFDASLVSTFEELVTRVNVNQVVTTAASSETIDFSTAISPEVAGYRDVARNADTVCVVEVLVETTKQRIHCKGPSGSFLVSIDNLPSISRQPDRFLMTPTHVLWEEAAKIFAAELKDGAVFNQIQIAGFDRLTAFNAYCGAAIFAQQAVPNAPHNLFFWSDGESTPVDLVDGGRISASGVSYGNSVRDQNGQQIGNSIVFHAFEK